MHALLRKVSRRRIEDLGISNVSGGEALSAPGVERRQRLLAHQLTKGNLQVPGVVVGDGVAKQKGQE